MKLTKTGLLHADFLKQPGDSQFKELPQDAVDIMEHASTKVIAYETELLAHPHYTRAKYIFIQLVYTDFRLLERGT